MKYLHVHVVFTEHLNAIDKAKKKLDFQGNNFKRQADKLFHLLITRFAYHMDVTKFSLINLI